MKRPLMLDLFGGFGGVALGGLRVGFDVITVDYDALCKTMVERNLAGPGRIFPDQPEVKSVTADLLKAEPLELLRQLGISPSDVAYLHASPECQIHSRAAGGRKSRDDAGHRMLESVAAWVRALPDATVTIENVVGVERSPKWPALAEALSEKREYRVYAANASWYGVPQARERVWVCAGRTSRPCMPLPAPTVDLERPRTWRWAMSNPCPVEDVDDGRSPKPSPWQSSLMTYVPEGGTLRDVTDEAVLTWLRQMYPGGYCETFLRRLHRDRPIPTVLTGPLIKEHLQHIHPTLDRPCTVREWARAQSFPDAYEPACSMAAAFRGVGNAVPPPMAEAFARGVMSELEGGGVRTAVAPSTRRGSRQRESPASAEPAAVPSRCSV